MNNKMIGLLMFIVGLLIIVFGLALILVNTFAPSQEAHQGYVEGHYVSPLVSGPVRSPTLKVIFKGGKSVAEETAPSKTA